jgi:hypothetical protein
VTEELMPALLGYDDTHLLDFCQLNDELPDELLTFSPAEMSPANSTSSESSVEDLATMFTVTLPRTPPPVVRAVRVTTVNRT